MSLNSLPVQEFNLTTLARLILIQITRYSENPESWLNPGHAGNLLQSSVHDMKTAGQYNTNRDGVRCYI